MAKNKKMKKKTLIMILDATIRSNYRWYVRRQKRENDDSQFNLASGDSNKVDGVKDAAVTVYDDVVNSMQWNDTLVDAVEAVDFNVKYVTKVIRAGLKSGAIKKEAAEIDGFLVEATRWIGGAVKNPGASKRVKNGLAGKLKKLVESRKAKKTAKRARLAAALSKKKKK